MLSLDEWIVISNFGITVTALPSGVAIVLDMARRSQETHRMELEAQLQDRLAEFHHQERMYVLRNGRKHSVPSKRTQHRS